MAAAFGIVDLFAGPGGLGEGFAALRVDNHAPFRIQISVEKEASAHQTLTLRAFLREYHSRHGKLPKAFIDFHAGRIPAPDWQAVDAGAWQSATGEAWWLELGTDAATRAVDDAMVSARREFDDTILIGGPPCQAYSLVGRARSMSEPGYVPGKDPRHYLFREYLHVLDRLRPAAFVMENVKGMLSSTVESRLVFEMLMEELASLGSGQRHLYELRAIRVDGATASLQEAEKPSDFVVHAEAFGVPQRRHRVIIVGVRSDLASGAFTASIALPSEIRTLDGAIGNLPALRSGLSRGGDGENRWRDIVIDAAESLAGLSIHKTLRDRFAAVAAQLRANAPTQRCSASLPVPYGDGSADLLQWLERPELHALAQHETRKHMAADFKRYLFAAVFAETCNGSPKAPDFPQILSPNHRNWNSGAFRDRFRVQLSGEPSATITSHMAKDGHYFIHPDPLQCRSLTVREAARLQTFPDDYLFVGSRTQQYVQVGNAVPPFLARQIAKLVHAALAKQRVGLHPGSAEDVLSAAPRALAIS